MAKPRVCFEGQVHLVGTHPEFTLCSIAFDAADSEKEEGLRWVPTKKRVVTCKSCVAIIEHCRHVPTAKEKTHAPR